VALILTSMLKSTAMTKLNHFYKNKDQIETTKI